MLLLIGKKHLPLSRIIRSSLLLAASLLMLVGCQTINAPLDETDLTQQEKLQEKLAAIIIREDEIAAREAAVSARETELVTLFAEAQKQKIVLENAVAQQDLDRKAAESRARTNAQNHKNTTIAAQPNNNAKPQNNRTVLGGLEYVYLDPPGINFTARIDTGAQTSSLNALDMVEFERDGQPYVKFHVIDPKTEEKIELTRRIRSYVRIKEVNKRESHRRPVVRIRVRLANLDERISFTLVDRSKFKQQVLIGRNLLRDLAVVDVSKEFTAPKFNQDSK